MIVDADIQEPPQTGLDAPEARHEHRRVEAASYEEAKAQIRAGLPDGWIVASWRVDRDIVTDQRSAGGVSGEGFHFDV